MASVASLCGFPLWHRPTSSPGASSLSGAESYPGGPQHKQHGTPYRKKGFIPGAHANVRSPVGAGGYEELHRQTGAHLD